MMADKRRCKFKDIGIDSRPGRNWRWSSVIGRLGSSYGYYVLFRERGSPPLISETYSRRDQLQVDVNLPPKLRYSLTSPLAIRLVSISFVKMFATRAMRMQATRALQMQPTRTMQMFKPTSALMRPVPVSAFPACAMA